MIANDNNVEKVKEIKEEVKEIKEVKEVKEEAKPINDDYQVVLDDRGLYKVGGKWFVKIRRINVREMISAWGIISSVFGNIQTMGLNLRDPQAWVLMFLTALPVVPGKFYQFLAQVMELQYNESLPQEEIKKIRDEYNNYLRKDLKPEELTDVVLIMYNQEKERFGELVKKVNFVLKPLIEQMAKKR